VRDPIGRTSAGPHSVACAQSFEEGQKVVEIMIDVKKRPEKGNAMLKVSRSILPEAETFYVRISVTLSKSKSFYIQPPLRPCTY